MILKSFVTSDYSPPQCKDYSLIQACKSNLCGMADTVGIQDRKDQLEKAKLLLAELPSCNRTMLAWLFTHMSHVIEKV